MAGFQWRAVGALILMLWLQGSSQLGVRNVAAPVLVDFLPELLDDAETLYAEPRQRRFELVKIEGVIAIRVPCLKCVDRASHPLQQHLAELGRERPAYVQTRDDGRVIKVTC